MNFNDSIKILNLDNNKIYDFKIIKKHYHFLALKYHPDKNNDINSKEKFQSINRAYNYLYKLYTDNDIFNNIETNQYTETNELIENNVLNFDELLNDFLDLLNLKNKHEKSIISDYFKKKYNYYNTIIINKLSDSNYFKELFKNFYNNRENNKENNEKNNEKNNEENNKENNKKNNEENNEEDNKENDKLIIINTDIENVLNDEIYILEINNDILYIPLWYKEVVYEDYLIKIRINNVNNEFIKIDEYNNIYIEIYSNLYSLIDKNLYFNIGKKKYFINNNLLYIKKINNYILNNCGILNPLYDISEIEKNIVDKHRSNIFVKLNLN